MGWVRDFFREFGPHVLIVVMLCCCPCGLFFGLWYTTPTENGPGGEASCDNGVPMVCTVVFDRRVEDPSATAYGKPVRLVAVEGDIAVVEIKALFGWVTSTVRAAEATTVQGGITDSYTTVTVVDITEDRVIIEMEGASDI
ncbi:hypothetical protein ACSVDM_11200 [Nocardia sp. JW2]|uniref:hypothetical protein n=1 Tax=Nocardia sp. JW2 TaxID=3450738 RepID=UPI003F4333D6